MGFLPSIVALSTMALVALWITVARGGIRANSRTLRRALWASAFAVLCQAIHFTEEAATELNHSLPALFELPPISLSSFFVVNLTALAVWVFSIFALMRRSSIALFPLWFLAVASLANAVLHPALALAAGGYFPGVGTAPLVGIGGYLLLRSLSDVTGARGFAVASDQLS